MKDLPQLETGDIILTHAPSFLSRLIQWVQNSYWNHALLVDEPMGEDYAILESIAKGPAIGLLKRNYSEEIKRGDIAVFRYYRPLSDEEKQVIRYFARCFQKHRYDHWIVLRIIAKLGVIGAIKVAFQLRAGKDVKIPHVKDINIVCSELIAEVFSRAGLPIWPAQLLFLPRSACRSALLVKIYGKV